MNEPLTEQEFEKHADRELLAMDRALGDVDGIETDLSMGVLTIQSDDGTKYIVNSHRAAKQIWMAAESSAWHFDYLPDGKRWVASKSGDELWSAVERVLSKKLGAPIKLAK